MIKTVHLTVTLKVELSSEIERDYLLEQLSHSIQMEIDNVTQTPEVVKVVAVYDPDGKLTLMPNVDSILEDFDAAASVWDIRDVLDICPRLSREDALIVLRSVTDRHDCHSGIQHCSFTDAIEDVLGINPVTGQLLDNTLPSESRNE